MARRDTPRGRVVALALAGAIAVAVVACGSDGNAGFARRVSYRLDEVRGTFRGVALGDREDRVVARFAPEHPQREEPVWPLGVDARSDGPPGTFASTPGRPSRHDRTGVLRYRGMSFVTNNGHVYVIMSSLPRTRAVRGVGVGDSLQDVRRAYPGLTCDAASDSHGAQTFSYCSGRLRAGHFVYFGGDPVGTVAVARVRLYG